jgi:hypothetical protein
MQKTKTTSPFEFKRLSMFVLVVTVNACLVIPLQFSVFLWIIPLAVFLDFLFAFQIKRLLNSKPKEPMNIDRLGPLFDQLTYATPRNEVVFIDSSLHVSTEQIPETIHHTAESLTPTNLEQPREPFDTPSTSIIETLVSSAMSTRPSDSSAEIALDLPTKTKLPTPKKIIPCEPVYNKPIIPAKYCDDLVHYLTDNGLSVQKDNLRELFACMAASKLILLQNNQIEHSKRFLELFSEFIGAHLEFLLSDREMNSIGEWFGEIPTAELEQTSKNTPPLIQMKVLENVDLEVLDSTLKPIVDFAIDPLLPFTLPNQINQNFTEHPTHPWFLILTDEDQVSKMAEPWIQSGMMMILNTTVVSPLDEVRQSPLKLSHESFSHLLWNGYERHFLEESDWKKIDQIEHFARQQVEFFFDNRIFRQLERYASTYLFFGGDKNDVIDSLLFNKMLRLIALAQPFAPLEHQEDIMSICEKLYGLEHLPRSKSLLKTMISDQQINP